MADNSQYPWSSGKYTGEGSYYYERAGNAAAEDNLLQKDQVAAANMMNFFTHMGDLEAQQFERELEWSRNSPAAQLQQLMNLGISRQQALAMIQPGGAQAAAVPAASPAIPGNGMQDILGMAQTAVSTVSGVIGLYQSCKQFGLSMKYMSALSEAANLDAQTKSDILQGMRTAGKFRALTERSKSWLGDDYDADGDTRSVNTLRAMIERAAKTNPGIKQDWDALRPLIDNNYYAGLSIDNAYMSLQGTRAYQQTEDDQDWYRRQLVAATRHQEYDNQQILASIVNIRQNTAYQEAMTSLVAEQERQITEYLNPYYSSLTGLTKEQERTQRHYTAIAGMDAELKEATFQNVKMTAVLETSHKLYELQQIDESGAYKDAVAALLDDTETAKCLSAAAKIYASDRLDLLSSEDYAPLRDLVMYFGDPNFKEAINSVASLADIESSVESGGFGPIKYSAKTYVAKYLNQLMHVKTAENNGNPILLPMPARN